jgi:hypothetical protein
MRARRSVLRFAAVACALALVAVAEPAALAAPKLPKPGTATQVAALVAASSSITKLPKNLLPSLTQVTTDDPGEYYPTAAHHCLSTKACVFGDTVMRRTIVLFGDSHAQMWLPALAPAARSLGYRLLLVWEPGCPAVTISVWDAATHSSNTQCNTWRAKMIGQIKALAPALVLLASRTTDIPGAHNDPTTNAQWQAGLETTIAALKTTKTQVAVVGDITVFSPNELPQCLAAYPTAVQSCTVKNPNGKTRQHFAAEKAAATAEDVPYLDPQPWLCTTLCSAVIGTMVAYFDTFHVSATYAEYLSGVWTSTLKPLLKHA